MKRSHILVTMFLLITGLQGCGYNTIQQNDEAVIAAWGDVEATYQRRADLIPNLVEVVKGSASHEKETLTAVTEARAKVALAGRDMEKLENTAAEITASGLDAVPFQVDMAKPDSISDLAEAVIKEFGRIDFLFNNAGMIHRAPAEEFPIKEWEEMIKVNLTGPFLLSQATARHMIEKGIQGSIVNTRRGP